MKWNKFLALLLSLMMILSMTAFASETELPSDPKDNQRVEDSEGGDEDIPDVPLDVPDQDEETNQPDQPEAPVTPEEPEQPEVPETPEMPEDPEQPEDPEVPETPETPETPAEDGIAALFDNRYDWNTGNSYVNHIDIACEDLTATVDGVPVSFSFTKDDVNAGNVTVKINGYPYSATGTSTDGTGNNQVRIGGNFPIGTREKPVDYMVEITKLVTVSGVSAYVTLSVYTNYWNSNNVCPGRGNNWQNSDKASGNAGIDVELKASSTHYAQLDITKKVQGVTLDEDKTFTFNVKKDGNVVRTATITVKAGSAAGSVMVSGLPEGNYTVEEVADGTAIEGYDLTTSYSDQPVSVTYEKDAAVTVTNTYTYVPTTTSVSVSKEWDDGDDQDGKRPETVTVNLLANGQATGKTLTLSAEGSWTGAFSDLPLKADGQDIVYTVSEDAVAGYESKITGDAATGYTVTNVRTPEVVSVSGGKTWDDAENQDGKRPESITIRLLADGKEIVSKTVTADDGWKWDFGSLPKCANGKEIAYTIAEDAVEEYSANVQGYNVTNSYTPGKTSVNVTKVWNDANNQDGKRPETVTVNLLANGQPTGKTLILSATGGWQGSFTGLDEYQGGKKITYTVSENAVAGYDSQITGDAATGYTVTNAHTSETTFVSGSKTWNDADDQDGLRPMSITVNLLANGVKVDSKVVSADANGVWTWKFDNLPKYAGGKAIAYTVSEEAVYGYTAQANNGSLINTHIPETTTVSGSKTWDDADDQDGKRPESITIRLLADGKEIASKTVTADDGWKWSFNNLPVYEAGKRIAYTIAEDAVEGYSAEVQGYDVTNSYTPGKTSVNVTKIWDDGDNQDGKRPETVTVNLLANGQATGKKLTLSADGGWQGSFTDLDEYQGGKKIVYTIAEDEVELYTGNVDGFVITNSYTPSVRDVSGRKVWDDDGDRDGIRPDSIVVYLWANGVKAAQTTATAEADWTFCFEGMPVYEQGKEILYTVTEEPVPGYTAAVEGLVITNTHEISVIDVCGKKTWDDENDADGKRPDSITIRLLADGVEIDARVVTSKEGWSWSFTGLPQYAAGKEIVYTLSEDKVDGYTTVVKGYNVTNVHEVEDDEVPKTGDARSDLQGILLMAGLALLMTGAALGATARKRGKN